MDFKDKKNPRYLTKAGIIIPIVTLNPSLDQNTISITISEPMFKNDEVCKYYIGNQ